MEDVDLVSCRQGAWQLELAVLSPVVCCLIQAVQTPTTRRAASGKQAWYRCVNTCLVYISSSVPTALPAQSPMGTRAYCVTSAILKLGLVTELTLLSSTGTNIVRCCPEFAICCLGFVQVWCRGCEPCGRYSSSAATAVSLCPQVLLCLYKLCCN